MEFTQELIIKGLVKLPEYRKRIFPFLKEEYFTDTSLIIFKMIQEYVKDYEKSPPVEALVIKLNRLKINDDQYGDAIDFLDDLNTETATQDFSVDWLAEETELYCGDVAFYNAIKKMIGVHETGKREDRLPLVKLLSDSLSLDFNSNLGHEYFENSLDQWEFYNDDTAKFPFSIGALNDFTGGGIPSDDGTLNIFGGPINMGKSIWLINQACDWLVEGKNVLIISMEMSERVFRERIDVNLMDMKMGGLKNISKDSYFSKINDIKRKTLGKLFIKEYPAGQAHTGHFRFLLNDLATKKDFKPDMIVIDYLSICASSRLPASQASNSNTYYTEVAKEFHALSKELKIPIWSAMQNGRGAQTSSDVNLGDIALAIGVAATADFFISGITNEELEEDNEVILKITKSRYGPKGKFKAGLNRGKMKFFDIDDPEILIKPEDDNEKRKTVSVEDWI